MAIDPSKPIHRARLNASKLVNGGDGDLAATDRSGQNLDLNTSSEDVRGELDGLVPDSIVGTEALFHADNKLSPVTTRDSENDKHTTQSVPVRLEKTEGPGRYILTAADPELMELLRQVPVDRSKDRRRTKFRDYVFTPQLTAFDRQNVEASTSPFHGFFSLFWMGVALMLVRISANNWRLHGSIFGGNEIVRLMLSRELLSLGLADGLLCASTAFSLLLQIGIAKGFLRWNTSGWVIQNIWQAAYVISYLAIPIWREWPWTHSIFITMHCITMLMKQHSFAFHNGHLSELSHRLRIMKDKLAALNDPELLTAPSTPAVDTAQVTSYLDHSDLNKLSRRRKSISDQTRQQVEAEIGKVASAISLNTPLDSTQIESLRKLISFEVDAITQELKDAAGLGNTYPKNLNPRDFYTYIAFPTVVYELEYPRQKKINWTYVFEKTAATFGVLGVMIVVSTAHIYPVIISAIEMKSGASLKERCMAIPWVFGDLLFPFFMEYLLSWYVIWECVLNVLAELTRFADRGFYSDWWNSTSWDQFARDWNRPVHNFLLRHVYHSSMAALGLSRSSATLLTFFLSACVHELLMAVIFRKIRGYLLLLQMTQLPLVMLSRTKFLKGRHVLGNAIFWLGIFVGPSLLCTLYVIL